MTKKITLLLSFILSVSAFAQQSDCAKFRNGTFKVTDPASKQTCIITRDGNIQTEKMEASEEVYDFDLVWIDDCTYTVSPTPATVARNKDVLKGGTMTVKIIKATDNSYTQRVTVANNPKFRRLDEVFLVESN